jgi:hypothetical protein
MASTLAVSKRNARQRQTLARGIGLPVRRNRNEILHSMLPDLFDVGDLIFSYENYHLYDGRERREVQR